MPARPVLLLLFAGLLAGCDSTTEKPVATGASRPEDPKQARQAEIEQVEIDFAGPVVLDSSAYVLYPLALGQQEEEGDSYVSKSRYEANTYWNIVFYNLADGTSHLLDPSRKMLIYSYGSHNQSSDLSVAGTASGSMPDITMASKLLYYLIRTDDFNHDGVLNGKDPGYLFVSDKAGRGFRQLSPAKYHVESWQVVTGTSKVLIWATPDSNNDQAFNKHDTSVPLVYDLKAGGTSQEVFSKRFTTSLKELLHRQWMQRQPQ